MSRDTGPSSVTVPAVVLVYIAEMRSTPLMWPSIAAGAWVGPGLDDEDEPVQPATAISTIPSRTPVRLMSIMVMGRGLGRNGSCWREVERHLQVGLEILGNVPAVRHDAELSPVVEADAGEEPPRGGDAATQVGEPRVLQRRAGDR